MGAFVGGMVGNRNRPLLPVLGTISITAASRQSHYYWTQLYV